MDELEERKAVVRFLRREARGYVGQNTNEVGDLDRSVGAAALEIYLLADKIEAGEHRMPGRSLAG